MRCWRNPSVVPHPSFDARSRGALALFIAERRDNFPLARDFEAVRYFTSVNVTSTFNT
jgi:hypothetical protein